MSDFDIYTIGHGTLPADEFVKLLRDANVGRLWDVRTYPGSRHNPQYGKDAMKRWLPDAGIEYRWEGERLGGRRHSPAGTVSRHQGLRHPAFRSYADWMDTDEFVDGVDGLLAHAMSPPWPGTNLAYMCSESLWWRCHRRLISDHLELVRGVTVGHIMHKGAINAHAVTKEARLDGTHVVYLDPNALPLEVQ